MWALRSQKLQQKCLFFLKKNGPRGCLNLGKRFRATSGGRPWGFYVPFISHGWCLRCWPICLAASISLSITMPSEALYLWDSDGTNAATSWCHMRDGTLEALAFIYIKDLFSLEQWLLVLKELQNTNIALCSSCQCSRFFFFCFWKVNQGIRWFVSIWHLLFAWATVSSQLKQLQHHSAASLTTIDHGWPYSKKIFSLKYPHLRRKSAENRKSLKIFENLRKSPKIPQNCKCPYVLGAWPLPCVALECLHFPSSQCLFFFSSSLFMALRGVAVE